MDIIVKKLTDEEKKQLNVESWPIWEKEISKFDWHYDSQESCLFLEGHVKVIADNQTVEIKKGDFAVFPKGLSCTWEVLSPVRKHYKFE